MMEINITSIFPNLATYTLLTSCCNLFNLNFQKTIKERKIKIFPSRLKKYLNNSRMLCLYVGELLVGYMIVEELNNDLIWIKQIVIAKEYRKKD